MSVEDHTCVICQTNDERKVAKLGLKGCQGLLAASQKKGDELDLRAGKFVHVECRRLYCHPNHARAELKTPEGCTRISKSRSRCIEDNRYNLKTNCIFCGTSAKLVDNKRGYDVFPVRTLDFQNTIRDVCKQRNDEWGDVVLGRIEYAQDLPAAEAKYHQSCSTNFRTGRSIPSDFQNQSDRKSQKGRPPNCEAENAFLQVMQYLEENIDEQVTVTDLINKMQTICGQEAYSFPYMKQKITEHFECEVVISELNGMQNVVPFKKTADSILHSFYRKADDKSTESEKEAIIKTAAKLISEDIKCLDFETGSYPTSEEIISLDSNKRYVPPSLLLFLQQIISSKNSEKKVLAIGQSIVQGSIPRGGIMPLQLGLGVQMHNHFGSKFLIDTLNTLGYCSSYSEVLKYEAAAASKWNIEAERSSDNQTVQFVADNVDHNIGTLDGYDTFHGMGIIATVTPGLKTDKYVPRVTASSDDLVIKSKINITFYNQNNRKMEELSFRKIKDMCDVEDPTNSLEFLIKITRPLTLNRPSWSGVMQSVQTGDYPGKSSVLFLPMIDLKPSDLTCIFSTLNFVATQASKLNVVPILTFDQPLYWKALQIITTEPEHSHVKSIVLRLGAFHTQMSFLGCIGYLMKGTGLNELMETVYAPNTVGHMFSGKAVSRAVRAHLLVDDALNTLISEKAFPQVFQNETCTNEHPVSDSTDKTDGVFNEKKQFDNLKTMFEQVCSKVMPIELVSEDKTLQEIMSTFTHMKRSLGRFRTAKLWMQYMDMVDILKCFIKAERTGNWQLHLKNMNDMLPYFAAAGHHLYLKSSYTYLQQMTCLAEVHPEVHRAFCSGNHVVRRSDRFWAGLSTDLVIEQVLMRSVKSTGGMTRGRGMSETQRAQWLLSMPACSDINNAMQEFTQQRYESSEQHKEACRSRIIRDTRDRNTFLQFLRERNPFAEETSLRNIETGSCAEAGVNVDQAKDIGLNILQTMEGQTVTDYTFKTSMRASTLGTKNSVKIGDEIIHVDPQLLFQRLMAVSDSSLDNPIDVFKYELCSHPSALFEPTGLLREGQKSSLANALWELAPCGVENLPTETVKYVLDGGSLIHRLPWVYGSSFGNIFESYGKLIKSHYGCPCIVFDGYDGRPTTKDLTHERRSKGITGTRTLFDANTPFKTKKELFLSNYENKQNFINLLSAHLAENGCHIVHARGDADLLIVKTAVNEAMNSTVAVIGEDTDLLILLCYHSDETRDQIYFTSHSKIGLKRKKIWDICKTKSALGKEVCRLLPFVHAFSGCDTTSRIYGVGKNVVLKKVISDATFRNYASVFLQDSAPDKVQFAGQEALIKLYNGVPFQGLDILRYCKFLQKVQSSNSAVQVQTLPPTNDAAKFHSFRVYQQVQVWLGKSISPTEWGWKLVNGKLIPIKTILPAAPERLLKMIRCCCKQNCDSKKCTCKKHGLICSAACKECHGTSCSNRGSSIDDTD